MVALAKHVLGSPVHAAIQRLLGLLADLLVLGIALGVIQGWATVARLHGRVIIPRPLPSGKTLLLEWCIYVLHGLVLHVGAITKPWIETGASPGCKLGAKGAELLVISALARITRLGLVHFLSHVL